jgi:hypothetical protein
MDRTVSAIIEALQFRLREELQGLGDFPKSDPFHHGVQVGIYQGLQMALNVIDRVLSDEIELDKRR